MKISIIVPIYKVEEYLNECIESIISQTYKNIEIILVDDGSPDNCPQICDKYAAIDDRIKVVHQKNKGLIEARKAGLRIATGDYVGFVDGDDHIESKMYENIVNSINEYNPDCVITQFYYSYPDKEVISSYKLNKEFYNREDIENEIFPIILFDGNFYNFGIYPNCWSKVFKKNILEKHLYDVDSRIKIGEDIAFVYPCLFECRSLSFIDIPLYHYLINPASMTKSYNPDLYKIYMIPYKTLSKKSNQFNINLSEQLPYYLLYLINFLIRNETISDKSRTKKQTSDILYSILNNKTIYDELSKIKIDKLPFHTKILYILIRIKCSALIKIYMSVLRRML